jgi:hypothetical protein
MFGARCRGCALLLFGVAAGVAAASAAMTSNSLLERAFGRALAVSHADLTFAPGAAARTAATAGDEGFWLTRAEVQSPAPFAKPLAVGDRITIAGSDGQERRLEVVDMKAVGGRTTALGVRGRLLLVSCRVTGEAAQASATTVRFLIEAAAEQTLPRPAKAL